mmetsp:Transcript_96357/g.201316  ORF Transcript_96357/g.201316 Transcript_96357/m.201316 type:complete len:205 (-) Transcript_96357:277-891(-)
MVLFSSASFCCCSNSSITRALLDCSCCDFCSSFTQTTRDSFSSTSTCASSSRSAVLRACNPCCFSTAAFKSPSTAASSEAIASEDFRLWDLRSWSSCSRSSDHAFNVLDLSSRLSLHACKSSSRLRSGTSRTEAAPPPPCSSSVSEAAEDEWEQLRPAPFLSFFSSSLLDPAGDLDRIREGCWDSRKPRKPSNSRPKVCKSCAL